MDPLDQGQVRLQLLEDAAKRYDQRLDDVRRLRQRNEGALTTLVALEQQIEVHRKGLLEPEEAVAEERRDLLDGQISGVQDAIAFIRAAKRAEESQGYILYGQELECDSQRRLLSEEARGCATRIDELLAQLEAGVPREDLGRPVSVDQARADIDARRALEVDAEQEPPKKASRRGDAAGKRAANEHLRRGSGRFAAQAT